MFSLILSQNEVISNSKLVTKKSTKYKMYARVVKVLKGSVKATTIIKQILNLGINPIMENFLVLASIVEK